MARTFERCTGMGFTQSMQTMQAGEETEDARWSADPRWVGVTGFGLPYPVQIRVGLWEDGTPACTGLKLGVQYDDELLEDWRITARSLRQIPLEQILVEYAAKYREMIEVTPEWFPPELRRAHMAPFVAPKPRPGIKGHPDDFYADVARRYIEARKVYPQGTYRELTREFNEESGERRGEGTVRRWVKEGLHVLKERGEL